MAKREIPEIDEAGELLEEIEQAEKARRELGLKMEQARMAYKVAKELYATAVERLQAASGTRLEPMPLFDEQKNEDKSED